MGQRVLVVTNEDLATANEVPPAMRPLLDEAEEIYVVAPTLTTWTHWLTDDRDSEVVAADARLRMVFDHMVASDLQPDRTVGAENEVVAIADALAQCDADLIILRLHAHGSEHENWREHGMAQKVKLQLFLNAAGRRPGMMASAFQRLRADPNHHTRRARPLMIPRRG